LSFHFSRQMIKTLDAGVSLYVKGFGAAAVHDRIRLQ
jgi:hypothetical protein